MTEQTVVPSVQIPPAPQSLNPLAMGGFYFGSNPWEEQRANLWSALETAVSKGINHFDTATDYGEGQSERLLGEFLADKREQVFVASKVALDNMSADLMLDQVNQSLTRLQIEENIAALKGHIPPQIIEQMTAISDKVRQHIPDIGNMYGYYP